MCSLFLIVYILCVPLNWILNVYRWSRDRTYSLSATDSISPKSTHTTYKFIIDFAHILLNYWTILQISIVFIYCLFGWLLIVVMVVKVRCEQFSLMTSFNRYLDFDGHILLRASSSSDIEVGGFIFCFLDEGSSSSASISTHRNWFQVLQQAVFIIYKPLPLWWSWLSSL